MKSAKHFVLVHGGGHGAWCWYKIIPLLKSAGHRVTAMDLACCGVNTKQLQEISSFSNYAQPLMEFMGSLPLDERVVLVGHSFGGYVISLAMEFFWEKIEVAIYVTAFMPNCTIPPASLRQQQEKGRLPESWLDSQFFFENGADRPPTSLKFGPNYMATRLYQECPPEDIELARVLVREARLFPEDLGKESMLSEEKFGSVSRVFVVCEEDQILNEEFQRSMISNSPPKEVKSIAGADHMAMLSKPKELCLILQEIAENY